MKLIIDAQSRKMSFDCPHGFKQPLNPMDFPIPVAAT